MPVRRSYKKDSCGSFVILFSPTTIRVFLTTSGFRMEFQRCSGFLPGAAIKRCSFGIRQCCAIASSFENRSFLLARSRSYLRSFATGRGRDEFYPLHDSFKSASTDGKAKACLERTHVVGLSVVRHEVWSLVVSGPTLKSLVSVTFQVHIYAPVQVSIPSLGEVFQVSLFPSPT